MLGSTQSHYGLSWFLSTSLSVSLIVSFCLLGRTTFTKSLTMFCTSRLHRVFTQTSNLGWLNEINQILNYIHHILYNQSLFYGSKIPEAFIWANIAKEIVLLDFSHCFALFFQNCYSLPHSQSIHGKWREFVRPFVLRSSYKSQRKINIFHKKFYRTFMALIWSMHLCNASWIII